MQELENKVPSNFERLAHRKGFVRYMSPELRQLAGQLTEGKQDLEVALSGVLKVAPFPMQDHTLDHGMVVLDGYRMSSEQAWRLVLDDSWCAGALLGCMRAMSLGRLSS